MNTFKFIASLFTLWLIVSVFTGLFVGAVIRKGNGIDLS
jgi:hypothetical protein